MKRLDLRMTLTEPTVLSMTAATTGAPTTADHIPGGRLLGWVASRLYNSLPPADAFILFHSGKVRFLDGLPLYDDKVAGLDIVALPTPFCLAWPKEEADRQAPALADNLLAADTGSDGVVRASGGHVEGRARQPVSPEIEWGRKTAVNPDSGRAADTQLFGYAALRAGQRFLAGVEFDDGVDQALVDRVSGLFPNTIHVGKSRAAEFGAIAVEALADDQAPRFDALLSGPPDRDETILWLLSDLAIMGPDGGYGRVPSGSDVGLTSSHAFQPDRSHVRTATYAPFIGTIKARMPQRLVIRRGSILVFSGCRGDPGPILRAGRHQEQGLGRMWVDPAPLLQGDALGAWDLHLRPATMPGTEPDPQAPPYIGRLEQARDLDPMRPLIAAEEKAEDLRAIYRQARALNGPAHQGGPKPSQWNRVRTAVAKSDGDASLRAALFNGDHALCAPKGKQDWGCAFAHGQGDDFVSWFKGAFFQDVNGAPTNQLNRRALLIFLRLAADVAREALDRNADRSRGDRGEDVP